MSGPPPPRSKLLTRDALLRRHGRPRPGLLVFTNGVFDVLHRGHLEYLWEARALGDALVVAVNSDASARRLKGPSRPVLHQEDRALLLAGLTCVDGVTVFDEDTPAALIAALLPDILAKGGDYRPEEIVGREAVERAGGRTVVLPYRAGYSTTDILRRLREGG